MLEEIKDKREIEEESETSRTASVVYLFLGFILLSMYNLILSAGIALLLFGVIYFLDSRYWHTKLYMVKNKKC
jgi:hypothetical protein